MQAPQRLHLILGKGCAQRRHRRDAGPLTGDGVHIALDNHQRRAVRRRRHQLARLGQAIEGRALVEELGLRPI